jgi:type IV secretion system protein VirB8
MSGDAALEAYWREAASWETDRVLRLRRSERVAWWAAGGGWLCALLCAAGIVLLVPLKQVAPFLIRVDNTTGIVDVVPVYAGRSGASEMVTRYLLTHYITVCERFNYATAESDYQECGAFHSAERNQAWYALWNPANVQSPLNLHRDGTSVRASVASVSFFTRASGITDIAHVRYIKRLRHAGASEDQVSHWIATVQYAYAQPSSDPTMRALNPLGFKVIDFRTEAEAMNDPSPTPAPPARAGQGVSR